MSCLNHNGFANSKNYEIPKLEVKKDICNILQRQAASVSLGQKVSREDVCLQLRNRNPIWLYLCKCPCCLNILSTTAVTSTTPGWCLSHHLSYDLPYSLGVLGCFLQGCAFLLLQQRTEGCRAHGEWAGKPNPHTQKACQMASKASFRMAVCLLVSPSSFPLEFATVWHRENILHHFLSSFHSLNSNCSNL